MNKGFVFLLSIFLLTFFFIFSPEAQPENFQFQKLLMAPQNDVIIVFNSGGWGNTPLERADDFAPVVRGIQTILNERELNSAIVSYQRTKRDFLGRVSGAREVIFSFSNQAEVLARQINRFVELNPGKKILMTGLSNGAAFVDATMEKLSENSRQAVFAIEAGVPFWKETSNMDNVLRLDNKGKDSLAEGKIWTMLSSLFKTPFRWILAKISDQGLTFSRAFQAPGHEYPWDLPEVGSQIVVFLEKRLGD